MPSTRNSLAARSRHFADDLQALLNRTVCDYAKVDVRILPGNTRSIVGTNLAVTKAQPIRLRSRASTPLWIAVIARLALDDDEGQFLTNLSSVCALSVGEPPEEVLHYNFERGKADYTEAHLQIHGRHEGLERHLGELGRKEVNALAKIHLPVGGRRFRPSLEDLLECLIDEGLVEPQEGWRNTLRESRREYRLRQVAAAVRRHHGTAIRELTRLGYTVAPPRDEQRQALIHRLITGET
jgi:hypothetical protein